MAFFVPRKNNVASIHRQFLRLLMLLFALSTEAFHAASVSAMKVSALQAWSLPTESFAMKSTWYNEYNPTARATVYNDPSPAERYSFVALGKDWPSSETPMQQKGPVVRRSNPLKRAWRRRALLRILGRRS